MLDANAMARLRIVRGADGLQYIHDPDFILHWATHVHIPQYTEYPYDDGLSGLGDRRGERRAARLHRRLLNHGESYTPLFRSGALDGLGASQLESGAIGIGTMALNFIPGVGPFLAAGASLIEGLVGGGDPTPEWQLSTQVMQLREAIALAHRKLGIVDSFPVPLPDATGPDHIPTLQGAVTEANGGPVASSNWRSGLYNAIKVYQGELQQLSQQTNNQDVVQQVLTALHQSPVLPANPAAAAQATPPDGTGGAPPASSPAGASFAQEAQQFGPWALGGAGVVAVLFLVASMIGGSKKK